MKESFDNIDGIKPGMEIETAHGKQTVSFIFYKKENKYIIYEIKETGQITYKTSTDFPDNTHSIALILDKVENYLDSDKVLWRKYRNTMGDVYHMALEGGTDNMNIAKKLLKSIIPELEVDVYGYSKVYYLIPCIIAVLVMGLFSLIFKSWNYMLSFYESLNHVHSIDGNFRLLFNIAMFASIGGLFSIAIDIDSHQDKIRSRLKWGPSTIAGLFRILVSILSGIILYVLLQSNIISFGFMNGGTSTYYVYYTFAILAGFSQKFVPNLLRKTENSISESAIVNEKVEAEKLKQDPATKNTALVPIAGNDAVVKKAFELNSAMLKNLKNVTSVGIGHDANNSKYIEVVINDNDTHLIPKSLSSGPNSTINVPVKVIASSKITTQVNLQIGDDLTNKNRPDKYGSFGLTVYFRNNKIKTPMLLTCYHVVIGPNHDYNNFSFINEEDIISPHGNGGTIFGKIRNAVRTAEIDSAIVDVAPGNNISNSLPDNTVINSVREIKYEEQYNNISVRMYGYNKKPSATKGNIRSINNHATIEYTLPNGSTESWDLYNLIAVSNNGQAISLGGDSGSAVIDDNNHVIGIVVAGDISTTYVMPIQTIFNTLNIQL
jgi:hypothetical protein